jgi:hypothetical protein
MVHCADRKGSGLTSGTNIDEPCKPMSIDIQPGQYVQAGMAYWTNINTAIWQQVVLLLAIQTAASGGGYALKGSWASVLLIALCCGLSLLVVRSIVSAIRVRNALVRQLNFLVTEGMAMYLRGRTLPEGRNAGFIFHDEAEDDRNLLVRNFSAGLGLGCVIFAFDLLLVVVFNYPDVVEKLIPELKMLGLPILP